MANDGVGPVLGTLKMAHHMPNFGVFWPNIESQLLQNCAISTQFIGQILITISKILNSLDVTNVTYVSKSLTAFSMSSLENKILTLLVNSSDAKTHVPLSLTTTRSND